MDMEFEDLPEGRDETQRILKEREKIKNQLASKLKKLKFTDDEIEQVLEIIDVAEAKIEAVKASLNGTNINTDDPTPVMQRAFNEIGLLRTQMQIDIRTRISEIVSKKR